MISELSRDNPTLKRLEQEYAELDLFNHSNWLDFSDRIDLECFRGEDAYLSQVNYGMTPEHYQRTFDYLVRLGEHDNLVRLGEDGAFSAITFTAPDGTIYSRDLLDSVSELRFLRDTLGLTPDSEISLLDIGSGYGRLLHRFAQMFSNGTGWGVDGVPLSTYLCDFYLRHRGVHPRVQAVPLGQLGGIISADIAVNAYGFGECTLSTIDFWLKFVADRGIRYFYLIPHDYSHTEAALVSIERDGRNIDYQPLFDHYGYRLKRRDFKYHPKGESPKYVFGTELLLWERG